MKKNTAQKVTPELLDWHRADIIAALKKRGWCDSRTGSTSQRASNHSLWCLNQTLSQERTGHC